jgi:hypothetical protein
MYSRLNQALLPISFGVTKVDDESGGKLELPSRDVRQRALETVERIVSPLCRGDDRLATLMAISVGRVLVNGMRRGADPRSEARRVDLRHIADWLRASVASGASWLENVDDRGRPKKLLKFSTLDDIKAEADRAMIAAAQRLAGVTVGEGDEEVFARLPDGHVVVRLLTAAALDRESAAMQHCIGDGAYDDMLRSGDSIFLSLRDRFGKPHATLELERYSASAGGWSVLQAQGKQNRAPIARYARLLAGFIQAERWKVLVPARHLGYVVAADGAWHPLDALPDGLAVDGDLDFEGVRTPRLPPRMAVSGSLLLARSGAASLPPGLSVALDLDLTGCPISELPPDVEVGRDLLLRGTAVMELAEGASTGRSIDLRGSRIERLRDGLHVRGNLDVSETALACLPEGLRVDGVLDIHETAVTTIPEGTVVGRQLDIGDTTVDDLPESIDDRVLLFRNGAPMTAAAWRNGRRPLGTPG